MERFVGQGLGLHDFLLWAPHREHFIVVTERGDLALNQRVYSLLLFDATRILESTPHKLAEFRSASNDDGIADLRWLDDRTVTFLGTDGAKPTQVYALDTLSKTLRRLTQHNTRINAYAVDSNLQRVIFTADADLTLEDTEAREHGFVVTDQSLADLLMGNLDAHRLAWRDLDYEEPQRTYIQQLSPSKLTMLNSDHGVLAVVPNALFPYSRNAISPDGRFAVIEGYVRRPDEWHVFGSLFPSTIGVTGWVTTFVLVDLASGARSLLLDAPSSPYLTSAVWAPDSKSVVVVNTFLPRHEKALDQKEQTEHTSVAEVNINTHKVTPVVGPALEGATADGVICAQALEWQASGNRLVLGTSKGEPDNQGGVCDVGSVAIYRRTATRWEQSGVYDAQSYLRSTPGGHFEIVIDEGLNVPPNLKATDKGSGQAKLLTNLNPQIDTLALANVSVITWTASDNMTWSADLYVPPTPRPPRGYPLVIQTHGCTTDKFDVNGFGLDGATGYAAQPLAGVGIAVLQVGHCANSRVKQHLPYFTEKSADHELLGYDSGIDLLANEGIADRDKIGLQGHSATSWTVIYAAAHPKAAYKYAAIVSTARNDLGYFSYLATEYGRLWSSQGNGGAPVGNGFDAFRRAAVPFNLERVSTPILSQEPDGLRYLPLMWEVHENLKMLRKPEELMVFPNGTHNLVKPWERLTSQGAAVDWFRFWLQGYEDRDPGKAEQYDRWRHLRQLWDVDRKRTGAQ
jgi:dipeptidyl aminopeptidase/acylaminoacyl peptidase